MKALKFLVCIFFLLKFYGSHAQNFKSDLKKLNSEIEVAYKKKKLTSVEYGKLKREQDIIQSAIEKAGADDVMTSNEKNKIHSKIIRSRKRLAKYKVNREVY